ncbi:ATP-binding protein [Thiomicrorhabdus sp. 6S3-12]|uniref:ATP-binding protein n=1 Tax=Thiomicrorhabdus sp. 6S3-12 TaxID=2819681 RepID=UPI001FB70E3F|nr:ATP-binding protein [Thiomicrorhabdus sp. 6S3-12]
MPESMPGTAEQVDWNKTLAAVWSGRKQTLRGVRALDPIDMHELLGIEEQKRRFNRNIQAFLNGLPANHVLLWGARGTGKSSLIKAALNAYGAQGLRVVELEKDDIHDLPEISAQLRELPWKFILYCDDLSFEAGDKRYRYLKVLMEGSIELPPENILMMATSNRRHLIPETQQDNQSVTVAANGELHYGDAIEEGLSLADRFGLSLSFYAPAQDLYLQMIDALFADYCGDRAELHRLAIRFASLRGGRSGRVAKQFKIDFQAQQA